MVLSSRLALLKAANETSLPFHSDCLLPSPWPEHSLLCNATYVLTEYDREDRALAFVPGRHTLCRGPKGDEVSVTRNPNAIAVEAPPGTMVVWHGNTWHGAFSRTAQGLRVTIPVLMARPYMRAEEDLIGKIPKDMLERNPLRFAILTQ